ncbi:MAG: hypothetical protein A3I06_00040 [Candidatus Lindowbacteria bacterium RIFCSPLOWO2_02_FULL_62_12]|nr:MAG: hypothetical protein A3I06_00040 [Candidatus Lindowbacteria bacterium RIFCSPLOWO2_02_FULL_62_12]
MKYDKLTRLQKSVGRKAVRVVGDGIFERVIGDVEDIGAGIVKLHVLLGGDGRVPEHLVDLDRAAANLGIVPGIRVGTGIFPVIVIGQRVADLGVGRGVLGRKGVRDVPRRVPFLVGEDAERPRKPAEIAPADAELAEGRPGRRPDRAALDAAVSRIVPLGVDGVSHRFVVSALDGQQVVGLEGKEMISAIPVVGKLRFPRSRSDIDGDKQVLRAGRESIVTDVQKGRVPVDVQRVGGLAVAVVHAEDGFGGPFLPHLNR